MLRELSKLPISSVTRIATRLDEQVKDERYLAYLDEPKLHNYEDLKNLCKQREIFLVTNRRLPNSSKKALSFAFEGNPVIVIDSSIKRHSPDALRCLAHEMSHIILGHLNVPNFAIAGYSETSFQWDYCLQVVFCTQVELEADLLAMMLILSDKYLDAIVEQYIYIPTNKLARDIGIDKNWLAARVQLYRITHKYERSIQLLKSKLDDPFQVVDMGKWFLQENTQDQPLLRYLPRVDEMYLQYFI